MEEIPCKNCIIFPVCKNNKYISKLSEKCILIRSYLNPDSPQKVLEREFLISSLFGMDWPQCSKSYYVYFYFGE